MTRDARLVGDAVLHEGYLLYPYQTHALKNQHRYPFGTLFPEAFCRASDAGDAWSARVECVADGGPDARLAVQARFLVAQGAGATAREAAAAPARLGELAGAPAVTRFEVGALRGAIAIGAADAGGGRWTITVELQNETGLEAPERATREQALGRALCSAHLLLQLEGGGFVSAIDPPDDARALVDRCRSSGLWPVLVGEPGSRSALLAAPIILYDYPELAPESPGDFFDGLEIDELLTLRVLTLTDEEKRAAAEGDPQARALLERTEALGLERLGQLHGRLRTGPALGPGTRVRLHPRGRADIFDVALAGRTAVVERIERDLEGRRYVVVAVEDDPGQDLGAFGHRFFFRPEEVEVL